ncbi:uncharacterized protein LY89DRAFT_729216 [Mollisia scopiformis]|uniref:Uncharacterized protein n=1 Tax=Mollisia scopiformis TaxID=149040 RepID=A0A194XNH2_MOLSC|nr:uncharacterized protein LY89DRAFT_729216 [Mollisia scopiformis]KUJ21708.1 hypothetical protein LY89DRAFT_729216 [Mollisia scopiformis]
MYLSIANICVPTFSVLAAADPLEVPLPPPLPQAPSKTNPNPPQIRQASTTSLSPSSSIDSAAISSEASSLLSASSVSSSLSSSSSTHSSYTAATATATALTGSTGGGDTQGPSSGSGAAGLVVQWGVMGMLLGAVVLGVGLL